MCAVQSVTHIFCCCHMHPIQTIHTYIICDSYACCSPMHVCTLQFHVHHHRSISTVKIWGCNILLISLTKSSELVAQFSEHRSSIVMDIFQMKLELLNSEGNRLLCCLQDKPLLLPTPLHPVLLSEVQLPLPGAAAMEVLQRKTPSSSNYLPLFRQRVGHFLFSPAPCILLSFENWLTYLD